MVWIGFCAAGKLNLAITSCKMDSTEYIGVLNSCWVPFRAQYRRKKNVFQQDNASIHTSSATKSWFQNHRVELLWWPACSPDLNPVENIWGIIVRRIYADRKQYNSVAELKVAITEAWESFEVKILKNLVASMPNRIYQVIERAGRATDY